MNWLNLKKTLSKHYQTSWYASVANVRYVWFFGSAIGSRAFPTASLPLLLHPPSYKVYWDLIWNLIEVRTIYVDEFEEVKDGDIGSNIFWICI